MQGGERVLVPKPPGFSLMTYMLNDTPMLRMVRECYSFSYISIEFLNSFLSRQFVGRPVVAWQNVGCFLTLLQNCQLLLSDARVCSRKGCMEL